MAQEDRKNQTDDTGNPEEPGAEVNLPPAVLIATPKQPFFDWLSSLPEIDPQEIELLKQPGRQTCWLLPSPGFFPNQEAFDNFLDAIKPGILTYELESWSSDSAAWPSQITKELFEQWFEAVFYAESTPFTELLDSDDQEAKQ